MKKLFILFSIILVVAGIFASCSKSSGVKFVVGDKKIDVMVNGKFFTSFLYNETLTKPVLFPVMSPSGMTMTRSFPFKEVEGESHDHPHHTGIFFTYDRVNQDGFWNNTKTPPQIKLVKVAHVVEGEKGTITAKMDWDGVSGKTLLKEDRKMVFIPAKKQTIIDFTMKLTAQDTTVVFRDTKEGMFAIRVAPWLKEKGHTGKYLSSNGDETEKNVWGRRAKWVRLQGNDNGKVAGIIIMNHPESTNYPTYWHARGYGLFAANPLGQSVFQRTRKEEEVKEYNLTLQPGKSALFKFRMIIYEGNQTKDQIDQEFAQYVATK